MILFNKFEEQGYEVHIYYRLPKEFGEKIKWFMYYSRDGIVIRGDTIEGKLSKIEQINSPEVFEDLYVLENRLDIVIAELNQGKISEKN
jgi:hypothetical protein